MNKYLGDFFFELDATWISWVGASDVHHDSALETFWVSHLPLKRCKDDWWEYDVQLCRYGEEPRTPHPNSKVLILHIVEHSEKPPLPPGVTFCWKNIFYVYSNFINETDLKKSVENNAYQVVKEWWDERRLEVFAYDPLHPGTKFSQWRAGPKATTLRELDELL